MKNISLRESSRAKWVRLVISAAEGLTVVVPKGYDLSLIPELLRKKTAWIEKHFRRFSRYGVISQGSKELPETLELRALSETWSVRYNFKRLKSVKVNADYGRKHLTLNGNTKSKKACKNALKSWLQKRARCYFTDLTMELATAHGFNCRKITIRCQRSRWGSCSSMGNISLNLKLLFFPQQIAGYVVIHELCHTVHMNHSRDFWSLLDSKLPNYKLLHSEAKSGSQFVPGWL